MNRLRRKVLLSDRVELMTSSCSQNSLDDREDQNTLHHKLDKIINMTQKNIPQLMKVDLFMEQTTQNKA